MAKAKMTRVLVTRGEYPMMTQTCMGRRWPCGDEGRDLTDVATSQGMSGLVEAGRGNQGSSAIGFGGSTVPLTG